VKERGKESMKEGKEGKKKIVCRVNSE